MDLAPKKTAPQGQKKDPKKKKKGLTLGLEGDNSSIALIFLSIVFIGISWWFYSGISADIKTTKQSIDTINTEKATIGEFLDAAKQTEITTRFPLYVNADQDYTDKKEVVTATEIRDLARKHSTVISGIETSARDLEYESTISTGGGGDITLMKKTASFIIGGQYENCMALLKDIEQMGRLVEFDEVSLAGKSLTSGGDEVLTPEQFFIKYGNVSSMKVSVSYYFLDSSIKITDTGAAAAGSNGESTTNGATQ